jgi:hypothetical protein
VLGCKVFMEHPGAVAIGKSYPEFWIAAPFDGMPASAGNGVHVSFEAAYLPRSAIHNPPPSKKQPLAISSALMRLRDNQAPAFPASRA